MPSCTLDDFEESVGRIDIVDGFYFVVLGKRERVIVAEWGEVAERITPHLPRDKSVFDVKVDLDADGCAIFRLIGPVPRATE
jgi:hypothetical protein